MTFWAARARAAVEGGPRFLYTLFDAEGTPVYVGYSKNVKRRLKEHYRTIDGACGRRGRPATWLLDVRHVQITGPHSRNEAIRLEQETIRRLQPRGNVQFTDRDPRRARNAVSA